MDDQIAVLAPPPAARAAPELTIVVPTFNERDNIRPLLDLIAKALDGDSYEVVFVDDDSRDGTLPATFEIVSGHAWKPQPRAGRDGHAVVRGADIGRGSAARR